MLVPNPKNQKYIVNAVGIAVMALAMFGIEVTPEQQVQIVGAFGTIGVIINALLDYWHSRSK